MIIHIFLDYDDLLTHVNVLLWNFPIPHIHMNLLISKFVFIWLRWFPKYDFDLNFLHNFSSHTCSYVDIQKKKIPSNNFDQNLLSSYCFPNYCHALNVWYKFTTIFWWIFTKTNINRFLVYLQTILHWNEQVTWFFEYLVPFISI